MRRRMFVIVILILVSSPFSEAKGGKTGVAKVIAKSIPKIRKMINASKRSKFLAKKEIKKSVPKITGLYKFKASNGKPYLGKSTKTKNTNVQNRLIQHMNSGKLHPKDIKTISFAKVDKKDISKVEKFEIMKADKNTQGNLANKQYAPRSNSKQKRENFKQEVLKNKALLKTKF